ncbi:MAG TPA: amidohydrolase [Candidatus Limnocylindria bacterium]|nr:amidohydrolase [Candidatus Limnocylindria bacterium]
MTPVRTPPQHPRARTLLFHGGRVHVGDGSSAEALVASDGIVVAAGRLADLKREHQGAEAIDLRGGLMTSGWHDTHVHFTRWAIQMGQIDLRDEPSVETALQKIRAYAETLPAGTWVLGGRFDKNRWGRWPTAADLDGVTVGRPAALLSRDGHARWLNTAALRAAGIDAKTPDQPGGAIERDAAGAPTGILKENANHLADRVVPQPAVDDCVAAIARGQAEAHKRGLTAIEDLEPAAAFGAFQIARDRGNLRLRVAMGIPYAGLDAAIALGLRTGLGDEWLRVGHLKIFADGALGSQTAALEAPYEGSDDRGLLTIEPAAIGAAVTRAAAAGIAVAIHAIGDRAVRVALDAINPARAIAPSLRQRVEHAQLIGRVEIARFGAMGVIASMQPIHATSDRDLADRYWGARAARAYPWRQLVAAGARLAFGSDAPVEPIDPLLGIHAAVARQRPEDVDRWHPEEALTLDEAIAAYTSGAAFAMGAERERGTLAAGMRCDATIVERDLASTAVTEWPSLKVSGTVVGGEIVHADGLG